MPDGGGRPITGGPGDAVRADIGRLLGPRRRVPPPSQAERDRAVAEYLANGGAVTVCPTMHAVALPWAEAILRATAEAPPPEPKAPAADVRVARTA